jgi:hypothetical protein
MMPEIVMCFCQLSRSADKLALEYLRRLGMSALIPEAFRIPQFYVLISDGVLLDSQEPYFCDCAVD